MSAERMNPGKRGVQLVESREDAPESLQPPGKPRSSTYKMALRTWRFEMRTLPC